MKISAILGPTNTGKTYYAVERMLKYKNGIIGFPLRLLARENYEKVLARIGIEQVGLITGEEKIIPKTAKFFFCTVEAMPVQNKFDFIAIDEIQLCSNSERGHSFTEKILNSRGQIETLFLGSLSIEKILLKIFPDIKIEKKPRLSDLKYYGYKNLTRIPPRSAVIAFSQIDVYTIAEKLKKFKGGASVVTGALSPEARNAQVEMYKKGEVDYIVATDAIGLGLNLTIKYIFFTSQIKFDGVKRRHLTFDEIAQIAGRAGRYKNDGYFGTTQRLKSFSEDLIEFIEGYNHSDIEKIYWRNSKLSFDSPKKLIQSLNKKPSSPVFIQKKDSSDQNYLKNLLMDKTINQYLNDQGDKLKLLWEICSIPDYTKTLDEFHSRLLAKICNFLMSHKKIIPEKWLDLQVKQIQKTTDKISVINMKISQIRIWSYIAFKKNWIENSKNFQKKIKKIENYLSNKLHQNLTQNYVDGNIRLSKQFIIDPNIKFVMLNNKNELIANSKKIGSLRGFKYNFNHDTYVKNNKSFSYKYIKKSVTDITKTVVNNFVQSEFNQFNFDINGKIFWKKELIGTFAKTNNILTPNINLIADDFFSLKFNLSIKKKVNAYFQFLVNKHLLNISEIFEGSSSKIMSPAFRSICFKLFENLGYSIKSDINDAYKKLNSKEISFLKKMNLKNGNKFFYLKHETNKSVLIKQMLKNIFYDLKLKEPVSKKILTINNQKKPSGLILSKLNKIGFYEVKVAKNIYSLHFSLYEKIIDSIFFAKKKKIKFNDRLLKECEGNKYFIEKCFSDPSILTSNYISI